MKIQTLLLNESNPSGMDEYNAAVLTAQPALQPQLLFRVLVNDS